MCACVFFPPSEAWIAKELSDYFKSHGLSAGRGGERGKKPNPNSNCFIRETPLLWGRALNAHYKVRTHCSPPVYITGAGRRWALTAPSQFISRRRLHSLPLPQVMAQPGSGCKATTRCLEGTAPPAMVSPFGSAFGPEFPQEHRPGHLWLSLLAIDLYPCAGELPIGAASLLTLVFLACNVIFGYFLHPGYAVLKVGGRPFFSNRSFHSCPPA